MSTEEEQTRYLEDALKEVKKQAFFMKRAMDGDSLKLALDHATEMLRELRTGLLSPKNYYELFMKIQDEMRELEDYLNGLHRAGRSLVEIYEQVQNCANVVPRLYLLCCVGGVYITSKEAPAKDILKDLIEMIKGVQHPMRGLFLRYYLTTISKNRLPDTGSPFEGVGGNIKDATSFLLQNFVETNRLWVRLQTQGTGEFSESLVSSFIVYFNLFT
jgi:vacuolar protein sorting-associated protein 35